MAIIDILRNIPGSLYVAIALALMLALEKTITIAHSNRFVDEYIPILPNSEPNTALLDAEQPSPDDEAYSTADDDTEYDDPHRILRLTS